MAEPDQVRPLAPAANRITNDVDEEAMSVHSPKLRQRKYIKCCGCITALILILAVIILILVFTLFHIKDPVIKMSTVNIQGLDVIGTDLGQLTGINLTLNANVSVKNPNVASFRFRNSTTTLYYRETVIGEARLPPGLAKARRTLFMNVTVDVIALKILAVPEFMSDLSSRSLTVNSYSEIRGRVKILKIIKKSVVVKLNCTMIFNTTSRVIQEQDCKQDVSL